MLDGSILHHYAPEILIDWIENLSLLTVNNDHNYYIIFLG